MRGRGEGQESVLKLVPQHLCHHLLVDTGTWVSYTVVCNQEISWKYECLKALNFKILHNFGLICEVFANKIIMGGGGVYLSYNAQNARCPDLRSILYFEPELL